MCSKLDIGVPQNRERLILVGIRSDLNQTFIFPEENKERKGNLKEIIKSAIELFHNIEKRKNLSVSEKKYLMKTIRNRLGYGIEIGYHFIFLPNFLFTILFFILSPVYFYKMKNFFAIIYRKIKELKYFKNSLMSN